jgi:hypothetical protein
MPNKSPRQPNLRSRLRLEFLSHAAVRRVVKQIGTESIGWDPNSLVGHAGDVDGYRPGGEPLQVSSFMVRANKCEFALK